MWRLSEAAVSCKTGLCMETVPAEVLISDKRQHTLASSRLRTNWFCSLGALHTESKCNESATSCVLCMPCVVIQSGTRNLLMDNYKGFLPGMRQIKFAAEISWLIIIDNVQIQLSLVPHMSRYVWKTPSQLLEWTNFPFPSLLTWNEAFMCLNETHHFQSFHRLSYCSSPLSMWKRKEVEENCSF